MTKPRRSRAHRAGILLYTAAALLLALVAFVPVRRLHAAFHDGGDLNGHMTMTKLRPIAPGDQARADAIQAAARKVMDRYTDSNKALADGYTIFFPDQPQHIYHFTLNANAVAAQFAFDPAKPTSLLYEKGTGAEPKYKLVGVMYTAPIRASPSELDARVPLSIAQWHVHSDICLPPAGYTGPLLSRDAKFGFEGSIHTPEACKTAGGRFMPHIFGWMVHVYAYEKDPAKIWSTGMDDDDDHMSNMKM